MASKSSRFSNFDSFQSPDNMDPIQRAQQYGFNGRIFISPDEAVRPYELFKSSTEPQQTDTSIISNIVVPNGVSRTYFSNDNNLDWFIV